MGSPVITLPQPEGGDEFNVVWYRHHGCPNAVNFRAFTQDPDVDLLQFSVGLQGYEMPQGVPFDVTATNECPVCGAQPTGWFQWKRTLVLI